jgi:hypothetical protein
VVEQAVQDVQDAIEPLRREALGLRRRAPIKPQAPKCYPNKGRSYFLSLGNVLFPFFNPSFAIGIGLLYWLITWQFHNVVAQYHISSGKIDGLGVTTTLGSVLWAMPIYLISALITSISLAVMLGGPLRHVLVVCRRRRATQIRRVLTKFFVGSAHFLAHVIAMFTLSLLVVQLNNQMTPPIERWLNTLYKDRGEQAPIVRDVIQEGLEPLQRKQATQQRERAAAPSEQASAPRPSPVRELVGFTAYPTLMIGLGALIGGSLWGFYWVLTGIFGRMHSEEAFAALRIKNYKNFLRLKFEQDKLTIYPLGIDKMPGPDHWMNAPRGKANPMPNNPS